MRRYGSLVSEGLASLSPRLPPSVKGFMRVLRLIAIELGKKGHLVSLLLGCIGAIPHGRR
jgi:hypothetical protein